MSNSSDIVEGFYIAYSLNNSIYPYIEKAWKQAIKENNKVYNKLLGITYETLIKCETPLTTIFQDLNDEEQEMNRLCKLLKNDGMLRWEAMEIFKKEIRAICVEKICKKEDKQKFTDLLNTIKNPEQSLDIQKAFSINMVDVLNGLGIKHNGSRCKTPFTGGSNNESTMSFKGQVFYCFKTGHKGNQVQFIQKIHSKTFIEAVEFINNINNYSYGQE